MRYLSINTNHSDAWGRGGGRGEEGGRGTGEQTRGKGGEDRRKPEGVKEERVRGERRGERRDEEER